MPNKVADAGNDADPLDPTQAVAGISAGFAEVVHRTG
jgi:hypothetical protein